MLVKVRATDCLYFSLPFAGTGTLNLLAFSPLNQAYKKIVKERKLKEQKKLTVPFN